MQAFIMINTEPGKVWEVAEAITRIKGLGVGVAHAVAGQYDVIAYVDFNEMTTLGEIIEKVQAIKGVRRTQTAVAIPRIE